jgi:hypothetical protein
MKLIVYTLNPDGSIPDYVIDGGCLVWANGGVSPQDYDLVGIAKDEAEQIGFVNEAALLAYANEKGLESRNPITKEIDPIENAVTFIWNKLEELSK